VAYHMLFGCSPWKVQSQDPGKMNEQWNNFTGDSLITPPKDEIIPERLIEFLRRTIEKDLNKRWDWAQFKAFFANMSAKMNKNSVNLENQPRVQQNEPKIIDTGRPNSKMQQLGQTSKQSDREKNYDPYNQNEWKTSSKQFDDNGRFPSNHNNRYSLQDGLQKHQPNLEKPNPDLTNARLQMNAELPPKTKQTDQRDKSDSKSNQQDHRNPSSHQGSLDIATKPRENALPPNPSNFSEGNRRTNGNSGFPRIVKDSSRLAPIYKSQIFQAANLIDLFCSEDILTDLNDEIVEMNFRLLLIIAIRLYLCVMEKLENIPIYDFFEGNKNEAQGKKLETDKENENYTVELNSLRIIWRNNLKFTAKTNSNSSLTKDFEMLKNTKDVIQESELRRIGKNYLKKVFRQYMLKCHSLDSIQAHQAEDMIISVYAMFYQKFDMEDHNKEVRKAQVELETQKLRKIAINRLMQEMNTDSING